MIIFTRDENNSYDNDDDKTIDNGSGSNDDKN